MYEDDTGIIRSKTKDKHGSSMKTYSNRSKSQIEESGDGRSRKEKTDKDDQIYRTSHQEYENRSERSQTKHEHRSSEYKRLDRKQRDERSERSDEEYNYKSCRSRRADGDRREERRAERSDRDYKYTSSRSYRSATKSTRSRSGDDYRKDDIARKRRSVSPHHRRISAKSRSLDHISRLARDDGIRAAKSEKERAAREQLQSSEDDKRLTASKVGYDKMGGSHLLGMGSFDDKKKYCEKSGHTIISFDSKNEKNLSDETEDLTASKWGNNWIAVGGSDATGRAGDRALPSTSAYQKSNLPDVVQDAKTGSESDNSDHDNEAEDAGSRCGNKQKPTYSDKNIKQSCTLYLEGDGTENDNIKQIYGSALPKVYEGDSSYFPGLNIKKPPPPLPCKYHCIKVLSKYRSFSCYNCNSLYFP